MTLSTPHRLQTVYSFFNVGWFCKSIYPKWGWVVCTILSLHRYLCFKECSWGVKLALDLNPLGWIC